MIMKAIRFIIPRKTRYPLGNYFSYFFLLGINHPHHRLFLTLEGVLLSF